MEYLINLTFSGKSILLETGFAKYFLIDFQKVFSKSFSFPSHKEKEF